MIALAAFALGTFFPNPVAKKKTQSETVAWAKQLGFGPPRFEYSNDKEFISSLKNCIDYLNFNIPTIIAIDKKQLRRGKTTHLISLKMNHKVIIIKK